MIILSQCKKIFTLLLLASLFSASSTFSQQENNLKILKVILKVETEDQGLRLPAEKCLTKAEIGKLRSLIIERLNKLSYIKLVSSEEKDDAIGILVVAEKLNGGSKFIILSSVLTIAKADGTDLFITQNVFAEPNFAMAAKAVVVQLVSTQWNLSGVH